jgi:hypothetical protein
MVFTDSFFTAEGRFHRLVRTPEQLSAVLKYALPFQEYAVAHRFWLANASVPEKIVVTVGRLADGTSLTANVYVVDPDRDPRCLNIVDVAVILGEPTQLEFFGNAQKKSNPFEDPILYNPISCAIYNCAFIKSLTAINKCRFPPQVFDPNVDKARPQMECCTFSCFHDILPALEADVNASACAACGVRSSR